MDQATLDALNRNVGDLITNLQSLRDSLSQATTGKPQPVNSGQSQALGEIANILKEFTKDFKSEAEAQRAEMQKVVESMKSVQGERASKNAPSGGGGGDAGSNKTLEQTAEELKFTEKIRDLQFLMFNEERANQALVEKGLKHLQTKGKLNTENIRQYVILNGLTAQQQKDLASYINNELQLNSNLRKRNNEQKIAFNALRNQLSEIGGYFDKFESSLNAKTWSTLTDGLIQQEAKFTQEIRAAAYETAGVTKNTRQLQKEYENIGTTVAATGVDRTKFQESYMKAVKGGIKDLKLAKDITQSQLNTEKQLGLEAGSLQDTFQSFAQTGRMTKGQIAEMGRGMREVAKNTGLTGEALRGALDSSREIVNQLKSAANLTAAAAKNVMELSANAKKLGVDQQMQTLQSGLTSGAKLLTESSQETQNLIFMAAAKTGRVNDAVNGSILRTKDGIKALGQGMEQVLRDFGVDGVDAIDQLSDEARTRINIALKGSFGMELGDMRNAIEAVKDTGKGLSDRLADINKKMQQNLRADEKKALMEEERRLKAAKQFEMLTALDEAAKGAKDMNAALSKFGDRRKDFEGDLQALGSSWQDSTQVAKDAIKGALDNVNKGLKDVGKAEIKIDSSEIEKAMRDPAALRELTAKITEGEQKIATAQKAQLDPITQQTQFLSEMNDSLRNMSQNILSKGMSSIVGKVIVMATSLGTIALGFSKLIMTAIEIKKFVKELAKGSDDKEDLYGKSIIENLTKAFGFDELSSELGGIGSSLASTIGGMLPKSMQPMVDSFKNVINKPKPKEAVPAAPPKPAMDMEALARSAAPPPTAPTEPADRVGKKSFSEISNQLKTIETHMAESSKNLKIIADGFHTDLSNIQKAFGDGIKELLVPLNGILECCKKASKESGSEAKTKPPEDYTKYLQEMIKKLDSIDNYVAEGAAYGKAMSENFHSDIGNLSKTFVDSIKELLSPLNAILECCKKATKEAVAEAKPTPPVQAKDIKPEVKPAASPIEAKTIKTEQSIAIDERKLTNNAKKDEKPKRENIKNETKNTTLWEKLLGRKEQNIKIEEEKLSGTKKSPDTSGLDPKELIQSGTAMMKSSLGMAVLVAGAIALAVVVTFVGKKILDALGLDMKTVMEVAGTIAIIVGAAAAIIAAAAVAYQCLADLNATLSKMESQGSLVEASIITLIPMALLLVALGAGLIFVCKKIISAFGLDMSTVMETAGAIGTIAGVTATIIAATVTALNCLEELEGNDQWKKMKGNPGKFIKMIVVGGAALLLLSVALVTLGAVIIKVSQMILSAFGIDKATAIDVGLTVAVLIGAVAIIALAVVGAMWGLQALGSFVSAMATPLAWGAPYVLMLIGAATLLTVVPAIVALGAAVLYFSKKILDAGGIDKATAIETGLTVAALLMAVSLISMACIAALIGLEMLGLLSFEILPALPMILLGAFTLTAMTIPLVMLGTALLAIIKGIMTVGGIDASTAAKTAEDVGVLFMAAGSIAVGCLAALVGLELLGMAAPHILVSLPMIALGSLVLMGMAGVVITLGAAIIGLAAAVMKITGVDASFAKKTSEALEGMFEGVGKIATSILMAIGGLVALGYMALSPLFWFALGYATIGAAALLALNAVMVPLATAVIILAEKVSKAINPKTMKKGVDAITMIATFVSKITDVMNLLYEKLVPLTTAGWIYSSPVKQIEYAKKELEKSLPAIFELIVTMQNTVLDKFKKTKDINRAAHILKILAPIVENMGNIIKTFGEKIMPFTKKDGILWGGTSTIEKIDAMKQPLKDFFIAIANLMKEGIIDPVVKMGDFPGINTAAKIMKVVGPLIENVSKAIKGMSDIMGQMQTKDWASWFASFGSTKPVDLIMKNKDTFKDYMIAIGEFLKTGIIKPILDIGNLGQIEQASKIMTAVAGMVSNITPVIENLSKAMSLMTNSWAKRIAKLWSTPPIDNIMENKVTFEQYFKAIALFIKTGIIEPIVTTFKEPEKIASAAAIMSRLAKISESIVKVIENLSKAIAKTTESSSWFELSPVEVLKDKQKTFGEWFIKTAEFMRDGIINPLNTAMKGVDMKGAAITMRMMAAIATAIVPIIKNLAAAMGLVSDEGANEIDDSFPLDKIISRKDKFADFFLKTAIFVRDGIVIPILQEIPDPKQISKAASVLIPLNKVLMNIRRIVSNVASILGMLSGDKNMNSPLKPMNFGSIISDFINNSILDPIFSLPSAEEIAEAAERIDGIVVLLELMSNTMTRASEIFAEFGGRATFFGALVETYNQAVFSRLFIGLATMLNLGLIKPLLFVMPTNEALDSVVYKLNGLVEMLNKVQEAMTGISSVMNGMNSLDIDVNDLKNMPIDKLVALSDVASKGVSVSTVSPVTANNNIETKVAASKAETQPTASVVTSEELTDISENSKTQTELTEELVDMFRQFLDMMKKDTSNASASGPPSTELNKIRGKPSKYFRSTSGQVGRGPGKQMTNLGPRTP